MPFLEEVDRNPDARTLRSFALTLLGMGLAAALVLRFGLHREGTAVRAALAGALACALGFTPRLNRYFYVAWMGSGALLGRLTSPLLLAVLFFFVFTPLGLLRRALGKDPLERRLDRDATTYWREHPTRTDKRAWLRLY